VVPPIPGSEVILGFDGVAVNFGEGAVDIVLWQRAVFSLMGTFMRRTARQPSGMMRGWI